MVETERPPAYLASGVSIASEQPYRLLVESVRDYAIFMLDPDGLVVSWNAGAERIKGYKAAEIIGQHFSRFYPESERESGKTAYELDVARREGRFEEEGWRVRSDGTQFWASVVITALRDPQGEVVGFAKVTRDLSERKRLEEQRLRAAQAEEAVRLRDEFLSVASHELRTPLTALQLQLGSLRDQMDPSSPLMRKLERAARSSQRLADLVEALLDVSRIAASELGLHRERCELGAIVRDVIERYRETAQHARCEVELVAPNALVGHWDRLRIEQVVTNLLGNALKYGAGHPVQLRAFATPEGHAALEVSDQGLGIPEERIVQIFDRFERAAPIRHFGGLGLGLYVAREIVAAHGGTIGARNRSEGGACVEFALPTGVPAAARVDVVAAAPVDVAAAAPVDVAAAAPVAVAEAPEI